MRWVGVFVMASMIGGLFPAQPATKPPLRLNLRRSVRIAPDRETWKLTTTRKEVAPNEVAIVVCDMWDLHWCASATRRCNEIAQRMAPVLETARARGVTIIHAPSDTMEFYRDTPQRLRLIQAPAAPPPVDLPALTEPSLPIDASDGGCDDEPQCKNFRAWKRQHPALRVAEEDGVSDNGNEIYNYLRARGVTTMLLMGVHTNMCVLARSFGLRAMTRRGINCVLVRDLTDTMYNPRKAPFVSHERGTELVIEHIERYLCPSILSSDLTSKAPGAKS